MPVFPAIAAFVASIVGYHIPVVCQPLTPGTTIMYQLSGKLRSTDPLPQGAEGGWVQYVGAKAGDVLTVKVAGKSATLPAVPRSTPATREKPGSFPSPLVGVPVFIALGYCNYWKSADLTRRTYALLAAIHESLDGKYAEPNDATTQCRTMKVLRSALATAWGHVPTNPGAEPDKPERLLPTARWRKLHPALWRRMNIAFQRKVATWRKADALWNKRSLDYASFVLVLAEAHRQNRGLPSKFHGATC